MKHIELVAESFNSNRIRQTDELKQHDLQTRDHVYWKRHLINLFQRFSAAQMEKVISGFANKSLCC